MLHLGIGNSLCLIGSALSDGLGQGSKEKTSQVLPWPGGASLNFVKKKQGTAGQSQGTSYYILDTHPEHARPHTHMHIMHTHHTYSSEYIISPM